jgi:hypothetical protein
MLKHRVMTSCAGHRGLLADLPLMGGNYQRFTAWSKETDSDVSTHRALVGRTTALPGSAGAANLDLRIRGLRLLPWWTSLRSCREPMSCTEAGVYVFGCDYAGGSTSQKSALYCGWRFVIQPCRASMSHCNKRQQSGERQARFRLLLR